MNTNKPRSRNFQENEVKLFIDIVLKYNSIIENRKTDAVTAAQKNSTWEKIVADFNSWNLIQRDVKHLRSFYKNAKSKLKKNIDADKISACKTGGGAFDKKVNDDDPLLAVIENEVQPINNPFDSSADHFENENEKNMFDISIAMEDEENGNSSQNLTHENCKKQEKTRKRTSNEEIRSFVAEYSELKKQKLKCEIEKNKAKTNLYIIKQRLLEDVEREMKEK